MALQSSSMLWAPTEYLKKSLIWTTHCILLQCDTLVEMKQFLVVKAEVLYIWPYNILFKTI